MKLKLHRILSRASALAAVAALLLRGLLLPLHEMAEAAPHEGCQACASSGHATLSETVSRTHDHPVHDAHDCAVCQTLHSPARPASPAPAIRAPASAFAAFAKCAPAPHVLPFRLPDSRAPPFPA